MSFVYVSTEFVPLFDEWRTRRMTTASTRGAGRNTRTGARRELAQRATDDVQVTPSWRKSDNSVFVGVVDVSTGIAFRVRVRPEEVLDAYHHPSIYVGVRGIEAWEDATLDAAAAS
jgi:hypothetical protein